MMVAGFSKFIDITSISNMYLLKGETIQPLKICPNEIDRPAVYTLLTSLNL
jgi:hypothetical protein